MSEGSQSVLVVGSDASIPESPLEATDLSVEVADSTGKALERLENGGIDCVLLAAFDPQEALDFVQTLVDRYPGVPALVATADDGLAERALEAGAADVVRDAIADVPAAVVENRIRRVGATAGRGTRCRRPLRDRSRILDAAVDVLEDVVYVVDEDDTLVAWNRTLPERLGYTDEEVAGMTPDEIYPEDQWSEAVEEDTRTRENADGIVQMDLLGSDGERIPHEFRAVWYDDDVTGRTFRIGVAREVSQRESYERQLRRQNDRIVDFTEELVRELRRCLEVAYAATNVTSDEEDLDLTDVEEALRGIERVVENAHDLARAGRVVVDSSALDLETAARSAWGEVETGDAMLSVADCECLVECDPARLRQLLAELFENAVTHSSRAESPLAGDASASGSSNGDDADRSGSAALTVRVGILDGEGGDPRGFYVEDSGLGVPAAEREMVFDPGYTTDPGAHGFGLAVVDEIASAHGWEVRLVPGDVGGARFEFHGVDVTDGS